ncbi:hypothetical protein TKK_0016600 [Trichogramma kaykai]
MTRAYWEFLGGQADSLSVARVRPKTSNGNTDLLLLNLVRLDAACPSKKISLYVSSKNCMAQRTGSLQDTKRTTRELRAESTAGPIRQPPPLQTPHTPRPHKESATTVQQPPPTVPQSLNTANRDPTTYERLRVRCGDLVQSDSTVSQVRR